MTDETVAPAGSADSVPLRHRRTVTVVDETDNLLGYKAWSELSPTDIHRASYLWVTNRIGQVLVAQRSFRLEHNRGLWSTAVTGTVTIGHSYASNIRAEAAEEIGLTGVEFDLGPKMLVRLPRGSHYVQWFTVVLDRPADSFTLDRDEVEQLRWVDLSRLELEVATHPRLFAPAVPQWLPLWLPR